MPIKKQKYVGKPGYTINHRTGWVAASGFYTLDRVKLWLDNFNPKMWMDRTLRVEDFIVRDREGTIIDASTK